jgi:hypothetical protein
MTTMAPSIVTLVAHGPLVVRNPAGLLSPVVCVVAAGDGARAAENGAVGGSSAVTTARLPGRCSPELESG